MQGSSFHRLSHLLAVGLLLLAAPARSPGAPAPAPPARTAQATYDALDYAADLEVWPAEKRLAGEVVLQFASLRDGLAEIALDCPELTVQGVWEGERPLPYKVADGRLAVQLAKPLQKGEKGSLRVRYAGSPTSGITIKPDQIYTSFHTDHWLVSKSDPGDKATLTLRLTLPAGLAAVSLGEGGEPTGRETLPDGRVRYAFREDRPYSTYLFGFAAGRFHTATAKEGGVELRSLAPDLSPEQLATVFSGTGEMLRFFARRAGVPFPGKRYAQVLLPGAPAQEMVGQSLLSEDYGRSVLADPREDYLVAHELSHQWWGNLVTCADWSDFWLNEGLATYMAAAYKEHHWGEEEYRREMLISRLRYERAAGAGEKRPLVFTGWTRPEEMSGPVTYSKGALVLHLLRHELGEKAFWEGLRRYTERAAESGGLVRTADFEQAMAASSGRDLKEFFGQWAYGIEPQLVARHRAEPGAVVVEVEQRGAEKPWRIGLDIAVETAGERVSRHVTLSEARQTFRFPVASTPLSVRLDDGGYLPRSIAHERPAPMLVYQATHEPDPAGRADALLTLTQSCGPSGPAKAAATARPAGCADLPALLRERAADDQARVVRQIAERALATLTPKPAR